MRRSRSKPSLRGSVQQNSVRMRPRETRRFGRLIYFGLILGSLLLLGGGSYWLWHSHWPQKQVDHLASATLELSQKAQFSVKDIVVEGRQQTSKESLSLALDVMPDEPIFGVDTSMAQNRITKLPWIASVSVERHLPDTIVVRLTERVPMARWQHDNHTVVIDTQGKELTEAKPDQFGQLPLVVGAGAPSETAALLESLQKYPAIGEKMVAAVWVSERRWDLHFSTKTVARLPANNMTDALKQLALLITEQKILDRDIVAIDLRVPERLMIEPTATSNDHKGGEVRL